MKKRKLTFRKRIHILLLRSQMNLGGGGGNKKIIIRDFGGVLE